MSTVGRHGAGLGKKEAAVAYCTETGLLVWSTATVQGYSLHGTTRYTLPAGKSWQYRTRQGPVVTTTRTASGTSSFTLENLSKTVANTAGGFVVGRGEPLVPPDAMPCPPAETLDRLWSGDDRRDQSHQTHTHPQQLRKRNTTI